MVWNQNTRGCYEPDHPNNGKHHVEAVEFHQACPYAPAFINRVDFAPAKLVRFFVGPALSALQAPNTIAAAGGVLGLKWTPWLTGEVVWPEAVVIRRPLVLCVGARQIERVAYNGMHRVTFFAATMVRRYFANVDVSNARIWVGNIKLLFAALQVRNCFGPVDISPCAINVFGSVRSAIKA